MNIMHVIDSGGLYGAEVVLLNLMVGQKRIGLNPSLLSLGNLDAGQKSIEIESKRRGLHVVTLRFRDGFNIFGALEILKTAKSLGTQIIHSHGYKGDILLGLLPRKFRNIQVMSTIHGSTSTSILSKMGVYEIIDAIAMKNLDRVVAVSGSIGQKKIIKYLNIKPAIINNGLAFLEFKKNEFAKEFPNIFSKFQNSFKILAIGRLSAEKAYDALIRAVAGLLKDKINAILVIVGEGEERGRLEKCIEAENLRERAHIIGYYPGAGRFLPDFDVFVLPSHTEGLPVTILEAIQAEIPIVATSVGEVPALLGNGEFGELVRHGDLESLKNAIEKVFLNKETAMKKARNAKKNILSEYSLEKMTQQYYQLYKDVIGSKK